MRLPAAGREYATWTVTGLPDGVGLEVSFDTVEGWSALELVTSTTFRALIAGPNATSNPVGTIALPAGRSRATIRATETPEVVIRQAGEIHVS